MSVKTLNFQISQLRLIWGKKWLLSKWKVYTFFHKISSFDEITNEIKEHQFTSRNTVSIKKSLNIEKWHERKRRLDTIVEVGTCFLFTIYGFIEFIANLLSSNADDTCFTPFSIGNIPPLLSVGAVLGSYLRYGV